MKCNVCNKPIYDQENINCSSCTKVFHFKCVGFLEEKFRKMRASTKSSWTGPCCSQHSPKVSDSMDPKRIKEVDTAVYIRSNQQAGPSTVTTRVDSPVSDSKPLDLISLYNLIKDEITQLREENKNSLELFKKDILTSIDEKYRAQDDTIKKISNNLDDFRSELLNINKRCSDMEETCRFLSLQHDNLLERNNHLETQLKSIKDDMLKLKTNDKTLEDLSFKINEQEQKARANNVEVFGIPENTPEDLTKIIMDIAKYTGVELNVSDIVFASRIKSKQKVSGQPKPVIVKFSSVIKRDHLISAIRRKKGCSSVDVGIAGESRAVYINEHLTVENKSLFNATRKTCGQLGFLYSWIRNGKIFVRKNDTAPAFQIRSEQDLKKLNPKKVVLG